MFLFLWDPSLAVALFVPVAASGQDGGSIAGTVRDSTDFAVSSFPA